MLALLAILGAVGAGLAADAVINASDTTEPDSDDVPVDASETADAEEAEVQSTLSMLDFIFPPTEDTPTDDLQHSSVVADGMPVSDDSPTPEDDAVTLVGADSDDILSGGQSDDRLSGGRGADQLTGRDGADTLSGGAGADHLDGGAGQDALSGNGGNDTLQAGAGNDAVIGGMGQDSLSGSEGDDMLLGGTGADTLMGGEGQDSLSGDMGRDWLVGGAGDDLLTGGASQDTLDGGSGNDTLWGANLGTTDAAIDVLNGGFGDDALHLGAGDIAMGGDGADSFSLMDFTPGAAVPEIVDYDPQQDDLVVLYDAVLHPDPMLTVAQIEGTENVNIMIDGIAVALLRNAAGLDLTQISLQAA